MNRARQWGGLCLGRAPRGRKQKPERARCKGRARMGRSMVVSLRRFAMGEISPDMAGRVNPVSRLCRVFRVLARILHYAGIMPDGEL